MLRSYAKKLQEKVRYVQEGRTHQVIYRDNGRELTIVCVEPKTSESLPYFRNEETSSGARRRAWKEKIRNNLEDSVGCLTEEFRVERVRQLKRYVSPKNGRFFHEVVTYQRVNKWQP